MFDRDSKSLEGEIVRVGRYCARLALSKDDLLAAQKLRYRCFKLSNDKCLDVDCFDSICRHVLIENLDNGKLICCYRFMYFADGKDINRSYSSQFYDPKSKESETRISSKDFFESITYRAKDMGRLTNCEYAEGFISHQLNSVNLLTDLNKKKS